MPRNNGDIQTFYNYEIELDDNKYLFYGLLAVALTVLIALFSVA